MIQALFVLGIIGTILAPGAILAWRDLRREKRAGRTFKQRWQIGNN